MEMMVHEYGFYVGMWHGRKVNVNQAWLGLTRDVIAWETKRPRFVLNEDAHPSCLSCTSNGFCNEDETGSFRLPAACASPLGLHAW